MASRVQQKRDSTADEMCKVCVEGVCTALKAEVYADSIFTWGELGFALLRQGGVKHLLLLSGSESQLQAFRGKRFDSSVIGDDTQAMLCPLTTDNAQALREHVPFLRPSPPRRGLSVGTGDRLGIATPGHIRAIAGTNVSPVLAQQSIRELARTGRSPREVLDDAMWGVLQTGYHDGFAADADHVKTINDLKLMMDVGFTMYTVDVGNLVDNPAGWADSGELAQRVAELPWQVLECTSDDCRHRYEGRHVVGAGQRGEFLLDLSARDVLRAAAKYGLALAQILLLYRHLVSRCPRERYAFEVAVDETDTPTSAAEHFFVAAELKRLGVRWESFAPRYCGEFYKGVEYVGNMARFRSEFSKHVTISEHFGGYKLSLHSGSDKFSIYPVVAELAGNTIHLKTSGTSYLEALRIVAGADPAFFRELIAFIRQCYEQERADYHVAAELTKVDVSRLRDEDLPLALDQPDTRQVCHVTYGAVLTARDGHGRPLLRDRLMEVVSTNEQIYYRQLEEHFRRHFNAFV